jgi:uncharacterized membrane protein
MLESVYVALTAIGYTHPIHPVMTGLPLGMVIGDLVFALAGLASRHVEIAATVHHCLILALISLFLSILLGYMDWQHYNGGAWLLPIRMEIVLAGSLVVLLSFGVWIQPRNGAKSKAILLAAEAGDPHSGDRPLQHQAVG